MEEAADQPPHVILVDPYFVVYRGRRHKLISGKPPPGLPCERPVSARDWQAYLSRVAWVLQILKLPECVLAALRAHAGHPRVRAHFTEKRLRQLVTENPDEATILHEIEQVVQGRA